MEFLKIRRVTLNKVLSYMTERPWKESNSLILEVHKEIAALNEDEKKTVDKREGQTFSQTRRFTQAQLN